MAAAADALARGWLLVVPPEGDVTPGRRVGPFASAFVYLAARARAPIVPTALVGSDRALRDPTRPGWRDKLWPRPARVEVSFLPPIATDGLPDRATADALGERVRAAVQREVDRLTGPSSGSAPPD
jgi:long-chain acyl-CoA synthetase